MVGGILLPRSTTNIVLRAKGVCTVPPLQCTLQIPRAVQSMRTLSRMSTHCALWMVGRMLYHEYHDSTKSTVTTNIVLRAVCVLHRITKDGYRVLSGVDTW